MVRTMDARSGLTHIGPQLNLAQLWKTAPYFRYILIYASYRFSFIVYTAQYPLVTRQAPGSSSSTAGRVNALNIVTQRAADISSKGKKLLFLQVDIAISMQQKNFRDAG